MTQYLGIEVSQHALDTALAGRKIEAIKIVRDESSDYVGLKDAKDAVETAMARHDTGDWLDVRDVRLLRRSLDDMQASRDGYATANGRLAIDLADAQREIRLLRAAITDHIFGTVPLPDLSVERGDVLGDSPF